MPKANIFSLQSSQTDNPIQEGDAVVIIRRNGQIMPMTIGIDQEKVKELRTKNQEDLTEAEIDLLLQGQKLYLLSMAASSETIMELLGRLAQMPGEVTTDSLMAAATIH